VCIAKNQPILCIGHKVFSGIKDIQQAIAAILNKNEEKFPYQCCKAIAGMPV
jgi:hypothetical protein